MFYGGINAEFATADMFLALAVTAGLDKAEFFCAILRLLEVETLLLHCISSIMMVLNDLIGPSAGLLSKIPYSIPSFYSSFFMVDVQPEAEGLVLISIS